MSASNQTYITCGFPSTGSSGQDTPQSKVPRLIERSRNWPPVVLEKLKDAKRC